MRIDILAGSWIARMAPDAPGWSTAGSRLAVLPDGEILCSFVVQTKLASNDFIPYIFRSPDHGKTWHEQGKVFPHLKGRWSIFANISHDQGRLILFGSRSPMGQFDTFWSDATQGILQNELIWSESRDAGRTWSEPQLIPMPIPGSAEAPGPLRVLKNGRLIAPYSPYNTFDPAEVVEKNQAVVVFSDDDGRTWQHSSMLRYAEPDAGSAEVWVTELADGRLLGTGWHLDVAGKAEYPDAYALSSDGGTTWSPTLSTGIMGQSTGLASLPDGRALFIYNQRKHGEVGVWLAVVRPTLADFGIEHQQIIWRADQPTQHASSGQHVEWKDFAFGEPSIAPLADGTLLATLWCIQPSGKGIYAVRLKMID